MSFIRDLVSAELSRFAKELARLSLESEDIYLSLILLPPGPIENAGELSVKLLFEVVSLRCTSCF